MQLKPREYFTIARGLTDHTDSNTYYVRAVIRNARTDELLDTVNLTDQGNRRFSYPWQVPADTSGEGFYILITTTVYSDSGYTSKSDLYREEFSTYLVADRMNPNLGVGGGGADIDYKKVRKIIEEELKKLKLPEQVDLAPVLEAVKQIPAPTEQKDVDFSPLTKKIDEIMPQLLAAMKESHGKMREDCATYMKEMQTCMESIKAFCTEYKEIAGGETEEMKKAMEEFVGKTNDVIEKIKTFLVEDMSAMREDMKKLGKNVKKEITGNIVKNLFRDDEDEEV